MASMTFQINDASTSGGPAVWVTITENANGSLSFSVNQEGGIIGDLRGLFFDLNDESVRPSLSVSGANTTEFRTGDDSIKDLGDGANMNGMLGSDGGFDAGIEIGSAGIGKDDIRSYNFTLASSARALTLQDFANVDFGVRLTSVGTLGGARNDSSKMLEKTFSAINAQNDSAQVLENASAGGNVLANDRTGLAATDLVSVTGWSGGALGQAVTLSGAEGATLKLNADGSYVLDASAADRLSAGERLEFSFSYAARNQNEATSWATDDAVFTVTVVGANDGPAALDDDAGRITEDQSVSGSVIGNDSDVDRLDSISVLALNGVADGAEGDLDAASGSIRVGLASGALVTMKSDGSFTYDTNGAFEALNTGDRASDAFSYTLGDNHGATDVALVNVLIDGVTDVVVPPPPPPPPAVNNFPGMLQDISNVVLYLDDGDASTAILKVKLSPDGLSVKDVDDLKIPDFIDAHHGDWGSRSANTRLVGISVHAGREYPNDAANDGTRNGEGAFFFLLDGETPQVAPIGTRTPGNGGEVWSFDWSKDDYPLEVVAGPANDPLDFGINNATLQAAVAYSYDSFNGSSWA